VGFQSFQENLEDFLRGKTHTNELYQSTSKMVLGILLCLVCVGFRCVLQCVAVCCIVLQCVAVCCKNSSSSSMFGLCGFQMCTAALQCVAMCCSALQCVAMCCSVLQCVAVCCSVLHCVAVCCGVLQCIAMCCSAFLYVWFMWFYVVLGLQFCL